MTMPVLIEKIGNSRYWNLPLMLREALSRMTSASDDTQVEYTTEEEFEIVPLTKNYMLTVNGEGTEVKLPPIEGNEGKRLFLSNISSVDVALVSNTDEEGIMEGGTPTDATIIPQGSVLRLICNKKSEEEYIWNVL